MTQERREVVKLEVLVILLMLWLLSSCAASLKELRQDPAIIGTTGFWLALGLNPAPEAGGIPLPSLKLGFGTIWRIGGDRDVTVTVGASGEIKRGESGLTEKAGQIPSLKGMSSLHITAKNPQDRKMREVDNAKPDSSPKPTPPNR